MGVRAALLTPALCLLSSLAQGTPSATTRAPRFDLAHPVALGARTSAWAGSYAAPGLGGHLKIRPWEAFGLDLFSDNFLILQGDSLRHDHVIGFSGYFPTLLAGETWFIAPTGGLCVDFRFAHARGREAPSASAILFGAHAGAMAEVFLEHGFSFQANASGYAYLGHDVEVAGWSATVTEAMSVRPLLHLSLGLNYYF